MVGNTLNITSPSPKVHRVFEQKRGPDSVASWVNLSTISALDFLQIRNI